MVRRHTDSLYHSLLRVSLLVTAFLLVFESGLLHPRTAALFQSTASYLSANAIGVFAGVEPNEINRLAAELAERERILAAREAALNEPSPARDFPAPRQSDLSTYLLSVILFILTVLVVLNYILDWQRMRRFDH